MLRLPSILINFVVGNYIAYHTLVMKYKTVWNDQEKDNEESEKELNKWSPLPNNFKFGEKQEKELIGARALIGGSKQHLLFITYHPNKIDVLDLKSFEYLDNLKHHTLPISEKNQVYWHCFVSVEGSNKKNKKK